MTPSEKLYTEIGNSLKSVELNQMFGKPAMQVKFDHKDQWPTLAKEAMAYVKESSK
jgi:hypothetical protein